MVRVIKMYIMSNDNKIGLILLSEFFILSRILSIYSLSRRITNSVICTDNKQCALGRSCLNSLDFTLQVNMARNTNENPKSNISLLIYIIIIDFNGNINNNNNKY